MNNSIHARLARRIVLTSAVLLPAWTSAVTPCGAETFEVTSSDDSGEGSLRQAIEDANNTPNVGDVPDMITFNIPGVGPHFIQPLSPLPEITEPVVIDGFTQGQGTAGDPSDDAAPNTDPDGNNADLRIVLDGGLALPSFEHVVPIPGAVDGLVFTHPRGTAPPSEVRGLAICKFSGVGLSADGSNVEVTGCSIGLDAGGLPSGNLSDGLKAMNSRLIVGGRNEEDRVVIGANGDDGVHCEGTTNLCQVEGTCIGTTYDCQGGMGNLGDGVHLIDTDNSSIGETAEGAWVVIADNCGCGAHIEGFNTENSNFRNVWFGTGPGGSTAIGGKTGACVDAGVQAMFGASNFAYHTGAGISTGPGSGFTYVNQTSFYDNWGLALDLLGDGMTMRNQFEIEGASADGSVLGGVITNGDPLRSFSLECCSNANPDNTGYGECLDPYAFGSCGTDADGNGACTASGPPRSPNEPYISCTLTDFTLGAPETFEFGLNFNRNEGGIVPTVDVNCPDSINVNEDYECTSEIGNTITGRDATNFLWEWHEAVNINVKSVTDTDVLSCGTDGATAECNAEIYVQDAVNILRVVAELPEGPDTPEEIVHCASAGADDSPPAMACTAVKVNPGTTDVFITKRVEPTKVLTGQEIEYQINVQNVGPAPAPDVVVEDTLPAGVTLVSAPASCTETAPNQLECNLGTLGGGESRTLFIRVQVTALAGATVCNTATVSTSIEEDPENNTSEEACTQVVEEVDLAVMKTADVEEVVVGETATYTVTVSNNGDGTATEVLLEDLLPDGVSVTTITPSQGTCEQPSADKITCDLGSLAPDEEATVTIVVSFDAAGEACNIASVTSDQIDANPADNDNVDQPLCVPVTEGATCGDPLGPFLTAGATTAVDALFALQAAVGTAECELCLCDINGSGDLTAVDALITLQLAVGQEVSLDCPRCA